MDCKEGFLAITKSSWPDLPKTVTLCFNQSILRLIVARKGSPKIIGTSASIIWNLKTILKGPKTTNDWQVPTTGTVF